MNNQVWEAIMKGFCYYRGEMVGVMSVVRNCWTNRTEYLIVVGYRTEWVAEDAVGEVVWNVG